MFSPLRSFLTACTRREHFEVSLDDEVRFHLDAYAEDLVRSGVPRREAVRRARLHFGSVEQAKDECRQARGLRLADELERMMANIRLAVRMLCKTPVVGGWPSCRSPWASGPTRRSSPSTASSCCARCRWSNRSGWSTSKPRDPSPVHPTATGRAGATRSSATRCSVTSSGSRRSSSISPQGLSRSLLNFGWRTSCLLYEVVYVTPRQQSRRRAGPSRPGRRASAADHGSPEPAGSASRPPLARSPPSVESSGRRATA